jgi:hypothetical protein
MQQGGTMSLKITTTLAIRRPTLVRVWRTTGLPGSPLTSSWLPSDATIYSTTTEGVIRQ